LVRGWCIGGVPLDLRGSYYVLEVGNFGELSPTSEAMSGGSRLSEVSNSSSGHVETQPVAGESGYYLLNTEDPGGNREEEDVYSSVGGNRRARYENIARTVPGAEAAQSPPPVRGEGGARTGERTLSPHPPAKQNDLSSYENIAINVGTTPPVLPAMSTPPTSSIPSSRVSEAKRLSGRPLSSYENIHQLPHTSNSSSSGHAPTPLSQSSVREDMKRSAQQRRDVYELMPLKTCKNKSSASGGTGALCRPLPDSVAVGKELEGDEHKMVAAEIGGGGRLEAEDCQETTGRKSSGAPRLTAQLNGNHVAVGL